ncbi:VOC family protein [Paraconexibacter sp.]|uniref:VOC family protein n=1 Tax=Paraconexibacter sp. TaxID=2949640 RepID=UPI00356AA9A3
MASMPAPALSGVSLGPVHLTVTDLERSVAWWRTATGLHRRDANAGVAGLGDARGDVVRLHEDPDARPAGRHAGLFHVALLYPSRMELSRTVRRIAESPIRLTGASDHGVSEALYLRDPDGNGVELYADRPRASWPPPLRPGERVGMFTEPLDVQDLLALSAAEPAAGADDVPTVGHVHLQVGDLVAATAFYRDVVGFDLMATYPGAAFLAADGYHHHVAVNTWAFEGEGSLPERTVGLRAWSVVLRTAEVLAALHARATAAGHQVHVGDDGSLEIQDPWGIPLRLSAASR